MTPPPDGRPNILRPGAPAPGDPALFVCTDCGMVASILFVMLEAATTAHKQGCIAGRLNEIHAAFRTLLERSLPIDPEVSA